MDGTVEMVVLNVEPYMAEAVAANSLKPFQTTKAKGLALGLSVAERIVDAHGETISVQSKPGEGTSVIIYLSIKSHAGR